MLSKTSNKLFDDPNVLSCLPTDVSTDKLLNISDKLLRKVSCHTGHLHIFTALHSFLYFGPICRNMQRGLCATSYLLVHVAVKVAWQMSNIA